MKKLTILICILTILRIYVLDTPDKWIAIGFLSLIILFFIITDKPNHSLMRNTWWFNN